MPPIILLVDNDESFIYLVRRYAEQSGFAFSSAPSVPAAQAMVGELRPALVVCNRLLAALADAGALAALQADLARSDIPIAGFGQAVVEAGLAALEIDYELTLPLLYGDFCAALAVLGVIRRDAERTT